MPGRRFETAALLVAAIALLSMIWLAAQVAHGATEPFDASVRLSIHSAASPGLTRLLESVTLLGSQTVVLAVSGFAALILLLEGRRDRALLIVVTMAGAELLLAILKAGFHRHRPDPFFGARLPVSYSFPSGHALLSFCCYATLSAFSGWPARAAAAALILAIGVSRIYLGVHYPSDVVAGYLVAAVWLAGMAVLYRRAVKMRA